MLGALVSQPMYNGILYVKNNWNRWFPTELKKTNYNKELVWRKAVVTGKNEIPAYMEAIGAARQDEWSNTKKKPRERFDWSFAVRKKKYILEIKFIELGNEFNKEISVTEDTYKKIRIGQWVKYWGNEYPRFADGNEEETFEREAEFDKLYFSIPDCCPGSIPTDVTDIVIKAIVRDHLDRVSLDETNSMDQITMRGKK